MSESVTEASGCSSYCCSAGPCTGRCCGAGASPTVRNTNRSTAKLVMKLVAVTVDEQSVSPAELTEEAELRARSMKILLADESRQRNSRCIGWKTTRDCGPHGPWELKEDLPRARRVPNGDSRHCELGGVGSFEA
ncbi:hypothetical protein PHYPSEUDO_010711 [Phytophthora pseudosyringae]|uniref:Uncharacterized protein n=1 Tax=Phytophthora pseudosyringae TaxID=221518 RepID=A0A8T1VAB7_9STRA|nr:hypothetical protein PHYPSEUDO_010711 [Phytophthora pseudosyringae]